MLVSAFSPRIVTVPAPGGFVERDLSAESEVLTMPQSYRSMHQLVVDDSLASAAARDGVDTLFDGPLKTTSVLDGLLSTDQSGARDDLKRDLDAIQPPSGEATRANAAREQDLGQPLIDVPEYLRWSVLDPHVVDRSPQPFSVPSRPREHDLVVEHPEHVAVGNTAAGASQAVKQTVLQATENGRMLAVVDALKRTILGTSQRQSRR